ncbi:transcription initiation factor IIB family protein [Halalkalirubrum salinum]|uniref:transcription initiation factor IIB family protein n=1 Tax=Halalkalirubrum salinum TaxID=2563889 RepID=UPI0010FB3C96|nr:transcription initiation factor IIB family protein [Halalkalirubrum salinum]
MYSARDRVENQQWIDALSAAAAELELGSEARSNAVDLFVSHVPDAERSKPAVAAAALYAGALVAGQERSQRAVAEAMGVTRLSVQSKWKDLLSDAGFRPPTW